jgi:hypothetical protein
VLEIYREGVRREGRNGREGDRKRREGKGRGRREDREGRRKKRGETSRPEAE